MSGVLVGFNCKFDNHQASPGKWRISVDGLPILDWHVTGSIVTGNYKLK